MEDINEDIKNLYIIRRRLAELTKKPGASCFHYYVGHFIVKIFTDRVQEHNNQKTDERVTHYDIVDINLIEIVRIDNTETNTEKFINLEADDRFKNYQPIKYSEFSGYSYGDKIPIKNLCELIKYLHRISNLSAFL